MIVELNSLAGMKLEDALVKYKDKLGNDKRLLYVLKTNMEKGLTKFGIAIDKPFKRLSDYVTLYGNNDTNNACSGVQIYFIGVTEYNRLVEPKNSQVAQIEKKLIAKFEGIRGRERVKATPETIINFILGTKDIDKVIKNNRKARKETKQYRKDTANLKTPRTDVVTRSKSKN